MIVPIAIIMEIVIFSTIDQCVHVVSTTMLINE